MSGRVGLLGNGHAGHSTKKHEGSRDACYCSTSGVIGAVADFCPKRKSAPMKDRSTTAC